MRHISFAVVIFLAACSSHAFTSGDLELDSGPDLLVGSGGSGGSSGDAGASADSGTGSGGTAVVPDSGVTSDREFDGGSAGATTEDAADGAAPSCIHCSGECRWHDEDKSCYVYCVGVQGRNGCQFADQLCHCNP